MPGVAVVTGGNRGIGLAISRRLARDGFSVAVIHRSSDNSALGEIEGAVESFKADVTDSTQCAAALAAVETRLGPVEVLVNNAGVTADSMFHRMTPEQWRHVVDVNLQGVFNMTRLVIEGMRQRRYGRIISISSINGQKGQVGQTNYSASKAALFGLTRALALESASVGITVNTIAPGYIATDMTSAIPAEVLEHIAATIPTGSLGAPDDVAACVAFLASHEARFITGSCLSVNGGQYMSV
jgi:acetoacetyl-CoA reductase